FAHLRRLLRGERHRHAGQMPRQQRTNALLMLGVGEAVQKAHRDRLDLLPLELVDGAPGVLLVEGTSTRPCASMRSRTGSRQRRGTSGGGSSILTSYCSKRFSWRISTVSRNPSVVRSAVLAPLRSMSALVASVVP